MRARLPTGQVVARFRTAALVLALIALLAGGAALAGHDLVEPAQAGLGVRVEHFDVRSPYVPGLQRETLVIPRAWRQGGPVLLWLHARGGDQDSILTPALYAALRGLGRSAPLMVVPSDNRLSFWHDRVDRRWGSYVVQTVLRRALALTRADGRRVAIGGISMGGFGAFNLARLQPGRFCAVGGHSPAIFTATQPKLPHAFDGARDFARNDLLALAARDARAWSGARLWLDVGRSDPFAAADLRFAALLQRAGLHVSAHFWPGRHAGGYWRSHLSAYLRFYASALQSCRR